MLFAPYERYQYARAPLVEVICQLRFPTILSIGAKEPAEFQEAIRKDFPQYAARQEQLPPKVVKKGNATALEPQKPITNYNFISEDGRWKLNLTQGFIALSTLSYTRWEDFATRLDRPLAQFIQLYQPAFFERIGLRYVNAVSRQRLGLEGELWDDLIRSQYIGILGEPDVEESEIAKCSLDVETLLCINRINDCDHFLFGQRSRNRALTGTVHPGSHPYIHIRHDVVDNAVFGVLDHRGTIFFKDG